MKDHVTREVSTPDVAPPAEAPALAKPGGQDLLGNAAMQAALLGGDGFSWTGAGIGAGIGTLLGGPVGGLIGGGLGGLIGGLFGSDEDTMRTATDPGTSIADMPDTLNLSDSVDKGMNEAWAGSLPGGNSQEQGGLLVRDADGNVVFKKGSAGDSGSFDPNYGDVAAGESLVGVGHTHPYGKNDGSLDGATGVTFSSADLSRLALVDDRMALVQSGDSRFAATRSKEFDAMLKGKTEEERWALSAEMDQLWQDTFDAGTGTFQENCDAAVRAVANKYKLGYYTGKGKDLSRVDTSK